MSLAAPEGRSAHLAAPVGARDLHPGEWLRAIRVRHWLHFLLLPLAGADLALGIPANVAAQLRGGVIAFAVLSFGYLLNGLADRHMDGSARKNPLSAGQPSRFVPWVTALMATLGIVAATSGPLPVLVATALALTSGVVYSVGPRLKRLPVVGTALNVVHFAPLLWVGLPAGGDAAGLGTVAACFSVLLLQNQLLHEASDSEDDRRGSVHTTFLLVGRRWSAGLTAALGALLVGVAVSTPALRPLALPLAGVHLLAFPWAFAAGRWKPSTLRHAHRLAALASGALIYAALRTGLSG